MTSKQVVTFRKIVWEHWRKNGRHELAWRKTKDPYKILVSEIMLQQTQVSRVEGKYQEFLKAFPNVKALAKASLADVLKVWSGLGYNRRAKFLHDMAGKVIEKHGGTLPLLYSELVELPGVGDYTAKAVRVFALNEPDVLIETNIRTVFIYHFFMSGFRKSRHPVKDTEIMTYIEKAAEGQDPREWHSALMDYGAHLKASGVRVNARSAHYTKQSKFEGSLRQVRGAILKALVQNVAMGEIQIRYKSRFQTAYASLAHEGLVEKR